jgi:hypothetical protein
VVSQSLCYLRLKRSHEPNLHAGFSRLPRTSDGLRGGKIPTLALMAARQQEPDAAAYPG